MELTHFKGSRWTLASEFNQSKCFTSRPCQLPLSQVTSLRVEHRSAWPTWMWTSTQILDQPEAREIHFPQQYLITGAASSVLTVLNKHLVVLRPATESFILWMNKWYTVCFLTNSALISPQSWRRRPNFKSNFISLNVIWLLSSLNALILFSVAY